MNSANSSSSTPSRMVQNSSQPVPLFISSVAEEKRTNSSIYPPRLHKTRPRSISREMTMSLFERDHSPSPVSTISHLRSTVSGTRAISSRLQLESCRSTRDNGKYPELNLTRTIYPAYAYYLQGIPALLSPRWSALPRERGLERAWHADTTLNRSGAGEGERFFEENRGGGAQPINHTRSFNKLFP
jgi:hypothetical protein